MKGLLGQMGYQSTQLPLEADVIIINSCSIREKAVHKIYSDLGRVRDILQDRPQTIVGLTGCVAQQEKEKLAKRFPFLDLVLGPDAIRHLPELLKQASENKKQATGQTIVRAQFDSRRDFEFINLLPGESESRIKAFVNIQKGCDNVCAFCIVPRVRGPEVSRSAEDIIAEVKSLVDMGVKEVTLLGQNVNSYGKKDGQISFATLLRRLAEQTDIQRLRFTSSHPQDVGEDLVACYKDLPQLCPHFHLPVQSGSNRILEKMRRYYTREEYLHTIDQLKKARPDIAFSTDIIIGFPGEEEADFQDTLSLMKQVGFQLSYSFIYSPRPGTSAEKIEDPVSLAEKVNRLEIQQELQNELAKESNRQCVGETVEVLVESWDEETRRYAGRTGTNKMVHFEVPVKVPTKAPVEDPFLEPEDAQPEKMLGQFRRVTITKAQSYSLLGTL